MMEEITTEMLMAELNKYNPVGHVRQTKFTQEMKDFILQARDGGKKYSYCVIAEILSRQMGRRLNGSVVRDNYHRLRKERGLDKIDTEET